MQQDPLPAGQSRVFIIGFENFSFYFLPRRSRIVSRRTAAALDQPAVQNLLRGFGASDCQCLSHLVRFPTREAVKTLFNALEAKVWIPQL